MTTASYSTADILDQLDECARNFVFPMLDNGYVYLADVRLTAYRDAARWALVIEVIGANHRAGGHEGIQDCLYCFGNCLNRPPGTANDSFLSRTSDGDENPTFDEEYDWFLNDTVRTIRVRETVVPLSVSARALSDKGIVPEEPGRLTGAEVLRSLVPEYRELLVAAEAELRRCVPADLPAALQLDEWHHPDLAAGELSSENRTFQMIADVLATGDADLYRPLRAPNTQWRNWPASGTL